MKRITACIAAAFLAFLPVGCAEVKPQDAGNFAITSDAGNVDQNGATFTITEGGSYTLTGTMPNGRVVISAGEEETVQLVLKGVSITCSSDSAISAVKAGKLKIKVADGTVNTVSTDIPATDNRGEEGVAAIYGACDVQLTGTGSLTVMSAQGNGIHAQDDLKLKEVNLAVTAHNNALKGNDSVLIESGIITAVAGTGDGIKTVNGDRGSGGKQRGDISVIGGSVSINAATDGLDAAHDITVSGGNLTITCGDDALYTVGGLTVSGGKIDIPEAHEGIEAHIVTISGGETRIFATDDGVNATQSGKNKKDGLITVSGGKLFVEASGSNVDGIDANGDYVQTGGFVVVSNPGANTSGTKSAIDTDGAITVTGGIVLALGTVPGESGGVRLPEGYILLEQEVSAGTHTFTCGGTSEAFELKADVAGGWIWAEGITADSFAID